MPDRNARFAATLIDVLARLGVRHACVTPGSRNTPVSQALAASPIHDWSHHDERSSAFFALGVARATGAPVVIVTTSGTAAAELHPAMAEAIEGRVPLIAITADRPAELRGLGAPQTIDQHDLFGPSVKWSIDIEVPKRTTSAVGLASRLWIESLTPPQGPVHLNLAIKDPLVSMETAVSDATTTPDVSIPAPVLDEASVEAVATALTGRRGVIIAGPDTGTGFAPAAARFAAAAGWPILADPLSGVRAGDHDLSHVVAASDSLAWGGFLERSRPEAAVRFGAVPTSKPIWEWLAAGTGATQVFIEPVGLRDPGRSATTVLRSDPAATLDRLADKVGRADAEWLARWRRANDAASAAVRSVLHTATFPNEPAIARIVADGMPARSDLWVASSMPIRDIDLMMETTSRDVRVLANRGANGIDGFISTALGSAVASGRPTVALAGDLSVLHDVGALAAASRLGTPLTLVAINNDGGGIFHLLPQAALAEFERHWGTPHGLDLTQVARGFGVDASTVESAEDLAIALARQTDGPRLLQVKTDRTENAVLHRRIRAAVDAALAGLD